MNKTWVRNKAFAVRFYFTPGVDGMVQKQSDGDEGSIFDIEKNRKKKDKVSKKVAGAWVAVESLMSRNIWKKERVMRREICKGERESVCVCLSALSFSFSSLRKLSGLES